jgi:hypothetical protein
VLLIVLSAVFLKYALTTSTYTTTSPTVPTSTATRSPVTLSVVLSRIVVARVYQNGNKVVSESIQKIAETLAGLDPSYVSGLVRENGSIGLPQYEINAFNTIRSVVLQTSPNCRFDIVLNAEDYSTPEAIQLQMSSIDSQIHPDIWFFDFLSPETKSNPQVVQAAVQYAHSHKELITGNIWDSNYVPPGLDFISTDDQNFQFRTQLLESFSQQYQNIPVALHLNNNPQNGPSTESCVFMNDYSTQQRFEYIKDLAANQTRYHYLFMYPIFFPQCPLTAYDILNDDNMLQMMLQLMNTYN